jgi:fumarylacetoacetate (FAA) hydrolase family protein
MTTTWIGTAATILPEDAATATLAGRVFDPAVSGPSVVVVRDGQVLDVSAHFATMRELVEMDDPTAALRAASGPSLGSFEEILANTEPASRNTSAPWLLSPIDLQVVKAAGVTFPVSMLERIIEERARGDVNAASDIRAQFLSTIGGSFEALRPGSEEAAQLKELLIAQGWWSQYLEVGIGPDAEVFTKAPVLSTVGVGVEVGILRKSVWNNPEPEMVLSVSSTGRIVGATLGNDVNLRDIEGRSALLLGKAKDNNGSAAVGPLVRFFDENYTLDTVRESVVALKITGDDGFILDATSPMAQISRDPEDLVSQVIGEHHQYPDGFVLYLGTLFAPVADRGEVGHGFTHAIGDVVSISEPHLGSLVNKVQYSENVEPWTVGVDALYRNLAGRGLLG